MIGGIKVEVHEEAIASLEQGLLDINCSYYVYLCGSFGRGLADEFSDIDFIVYCTMMPLQDQRRRAISLGSSVLWSHNHNDMLIFKGFKVDLNYMDQNTLERIIKGRGLDYMNYVINTRSLSKLKREVEAEKQSFNPNDFCYSSKEMYERLERLLLDSEKLDVAARRGDVLYFNYLINYFIERILKVIYSINNVPYIYPKRSTEIIAKMELPPLLVQNLVDIAEKPNRGDGLQVKIRTIRESISLLRSTLNDRSS